jgi:hypothetical protein
MGYDEPRRIVPAGLLLYAGSILAEAETVF